MTQGAFGKASASAVLPMLVLALAATGCLFIPYPVPSEVERIEDVRLADDVQVSAGPRRLLDSISDNLRKRMQGKSCFNFSKQDPDLFDELAALTRTG